MGSLELHESLYRSLSIGCDGRDVNGPPFHNMLCVCGKSLNLSWVAAKHISVVISIDRVKMFDFHHFYSPPFFSPLLPAHKKRSHHCVYTWTELVGILAIIDILLIEMVHSIDAQFIQAYNLVFSKERKCFNKIVYTFSGSFFIETSNKKENYPNAQWCSVVLAVGNFQFQLQRILFSQWRNKWLRKESDFEFCLRILGWKPSLHSKNWASSVTNDP